MKITTKQSVLIPVKFFSWFKFPLKLSEIRRYQWKISAQEYEINKIVTKHLLLESKKDVVSIDVSAKERIDRTDRAKLLWGTVEKWRKLFSWVPYISQVYVSNTLSYNNAGRNSDIDILVVAKAGRIWTSRAAMLVLMNIFKIRVQSRDKWNKFSPEFFVSDRAQNIKNLSIDDDYYLSYWLADLVPIWPDGEHKKFRQENSWFKENLPNAWISPRIRKDFVLLKPNFARNLLENFLDSRMGDNLEENLYRKQRQIIIRNTKKLGVNSSVVTNRDIIKVHFNDRRESVRDAINETLDQTVAKDKSDIKLAVTN
ncbi:MAG: hypothetical protein U9M89_02420 [Patescibacteria group bacterium]|nr:hypothetical protein [Patescibacteria group bacterium]